jgi:hypothetical protein
MHVAALPRCTGQDLADRLLEAGMIVGDDKFDAKQPALLGPQQKIAPARPALAIGELDTEDLTLPVRYPAKAL